MAATLVTPYARSAFPAFKVFIYGIDVTPDVDRVSVVWHIGNSPSTCSINLLNPDNKFTLTLNDIREMRGEPLVDEQEFISSTTVKLSSQLPQEIANEILLNPPRAGLTKVGGVPGIRTIAGVPGRVQTYRKTLKDTFIRRKQLENRTQKGVVELNSRNEPTGKILVAPRYEFTQGRTVFHSSDPVRVAFRDPFNPAIWYWMFSGEITDSGDTVDEDNFRMVEILCESVLRKFKWSRITTNPGVLDADKIPDTQKVAILHRFYTNALSGFDLPEAMAFMVFGTAPFKLEGDRASIRDLELTATQRRRLLFDLELGDDISKIAKRVEVRPDGSHVATIQILDAVGNFDLKGSRIFVFKTAFGGILRTSLISQIKVEPTSLKDYQKLVDHTVRFSDLVDMRRAGVEGSPPVLNEASSTLEDVVNIIGTDRHSYPIDAGKLYMLLPDNFGALLDASSAEREYGITPAMLTEFNNRLNLIYEAVSRFDYYFTTDPRGNLLVEMPLYDFMPDAFPDPPTFVLRPHDVYQDQGTFSDAKIRTQISCQPRLVKDFNAVGRHPIPVVFSNDALVVQFGPRIEQGDPYGFITTIEGAALFCQLALNKINADAYTMHVTTVPKFGAWINRPYLVKGRNYMGHCLKLTHNIAWTAMECSTTMDLGYSRGWTGEVDTNGNMIYTHIGGQNRPLDYAKLAKGK